MINNYKELITLIDEINENIEKYSTEDGRKIKKNNDEINKLVNALEEANKIILNKLISFKDSIINNIENETINATKDNINNLINMLTITNGYNYLETLGINKCIYKLKIDTNLEKIKKHIKDLLEIFNKANIKLTENDFNYSPYVRTFMTTFINSHENFDEELKKCFEDIYWKNPDIVKEIILCIYKITEKYGKELKIYADKYQEEILNNIKVSSILPSLEKEEEKLESLINYDPMTTINNFINDVENINDYQIDSKIREDNINKITNYEEFTKLSEQDKINFYNNINLLYEAICEYEFIKKYEPLIKDIKTIYDKKDELKDELKTKLETISKLYKEKDKLDKDLLKCNNNLEKVENKKKSFFNKKDNTKKINELKNKITIAINNLDSKIDEIEKEYENIFDVEFNNLVITSLNESSTIYDGLYLYLKYITKLNMSLTKYYPNEENTEKLREEFTRFIYNTGNIILNTLKLKDNIEFNTLIEGKYKLYNINCTVSEENKDLKKCLEYLLKDYYLNKCPKSREDIKLAYEINKITKEN